MKKGTYWTRAWIHALLGATSWKDAKTWWRCMSGTICWRSPQPAKCNTFPGCPFCFSFYLMMTQSVAPSFPGCAFYFSCKRLPMQSYWWHKVQHIDSYVNQGILVSCKVTFFWWTFSGLWSDIFKMGILTQMMMMVTKKILSRKLQTTPLQRHTEKIRIRNC